VPQLDAMLRALADRGARELHLKEGAQPTFRFPDGDRPVSPTALSRAQILKLVGELSTAPVQDGGSSRFVYKMQDGRSFTVEAGPAPSGFLAKLVPQGVPAPVAATAAPQGNARFDPKKVREGAPAIEAYLQYLVDSPKKVVHDEIRVIVCSSPKSQPTHPDHCYLGHMSGYGFRHILP